MYLRISPAHFDPARYDEMLELVPEIAGAVQSLPGNQSVQIGIDRTAGRTFTVSTWDTEAHANFSRLNGRLGKVVLKLVSLGVQIDRPEISEIVT